MAFLCNQAWKTPFQAKAQQQGLEIDSI